MDTAPQTLSLICPSCRDHGEYLESGPLPCQNCGYRLDWADPQIVRVEMEPVPQNRTKFTWYGDHGEH